MYTVKSGYKTEKLYPNFGLWWSSILSGGANLTTTREFKYLGFGFMFSLFLDNYAFFPYYFNLVFRFLFLYGLSRGINYINKSRPHVLDTFDDKFRAFAYLVVWFDQIHLSISWSQRNGNSLIDLRTGLLNSLSSSIDRSSFCTLRQVGISALRNLFYKLVLCIVNISSSRCIARPQNSLLVRYFEPLVSCC